MGKDTLIPVASIAACLLAPIILIGFGFLGRAILRPKGYSGWVGFALGVLGVVGIVIALVLPKSAQPGRLASSAPAKESTKPVSGECYRCHKSLGLSVGKGILDKVAGWPYPCKSCGTDYCGNCMAYTIEHNNRVCSYCGKYVGSYQISFKC
jgi:hypothetical protein